MLKIIRNFFIFIFLASCLGLGAIAYFSYSYINTPAYENAQALAVEIPEGSSLQQICQILADNNIINDTVKFKLYAQFKNAATHIQAGTFLLSPAWTPKTILSELTTGSGILYKLTIREGLPWWETARILEEQGYCKASDFKEVIHDKEFLLKKNIPFKNAEGYLYPSTYFLRKPKEMTKETAYTAVNRLIDTFYEKTKDLMDNAQYESIFHNPQKLNELLTLASIIEKETKLIEERPIVAGVYTNRLKKNMILQADPTVIYGLGENYRGQLLTKHLQDADNPYNTYQHAGLPPSPICSPSLSAIKAALEPQEHDYIFFVAKGIGASHVFSTNLQDHNKAVREYRNNLKRNQ